jgi:hypothetical protein
MAMMAVHKTQPPGERHGRAQPVNAQAPGGLKKAGPAVLAAGFIGDQVECGRDEAACLARQAGPGPRI